MVALLTSVRNSPCFGGLRRTKTCHRQLFARPSVFLRYFLHAAKSTKNRSLFGNARGFPNLESAHPNNNFPLTKLKPSQRELRGSANLESAHPNPNFALTQLNPSAALGSTSFRLTAVSCCCRNIFNLRRLSRRRLKPQPVLIVGRQPFRIKVRIVRKLQYLRHAFTGRRRKLDNRHAGVSHIKPRRK